MKQVGLIATVLILVVALVYLNQGINRNTGVDQGDAQATQQPQSQIPTPPNEETIGNPKTAKYRVTVGWTYDEANHDGPQKMYQALDAIRQTIRKCHNASLQMANLMVPANARPTTNKAVTKLGLAINGHTVPHFDGVPGEGLATPSHFQMALRSMIN